ncbi:MAG: thioredoxin family protein [Terriglobales bacterium]
MKNRVVKFFKSPPLGLILFVALVLAIVCGRIEQSYNDWVAASGHAVIEFTDLTSANASDVLSNSTEPIVIFASSDNADSKGEAEILQASLGKYANQAVFLRLDVDAEPDLASALQITPDQTPQLLLVVANPQGGLRPINQSSGLLDEKSAQQFMDAGLSKLSPAPTN